MFLCYAQVEQLKFTRFLVWTLGRGADWPQLVSDTLPNNGQVERLMKCEWRRGKSISLSVHAGRLLWGSCSADWARKLFRKESMSGPKSKSCVCKRLLPWRYRLTRYLSSRIPSRHVASTQCQPHFTRSRNQQFD